MFPGAAGSNTVTVEITGNAVPLAAAVEQARISLGGLSESTAAANAESGLLSGGIGDLVDMAGNWIVTSGATMAAMEAWQIFNDVANWVQNLIQQMFQLDEQTQKTVNSWQYLFGGVKKAQQLAGWTYNESPNLPFTAVDMRGAVSQLGTLGMSPKQVEWFVPILSDLASTLGASAYGGRGVTLTQAALAIREAQMGLTRMLKTDLNINPEALLAYGLKGTKTATGVHITDMSTLYTALYNYAKAKHLLGASQEQETNTFWGAQSSLTDRIQNWLQTAGGIDPATGQTRKGSFFGSLQNDLIGISDWMQKNQGLLSSISDMIGNVLGGAVQAATNAFTGFFQGLQQGGAGDYAKKEFNVFKDFGEWLSNKKTQQDIHDFAKGVGDLMGQADKFATKTAPELKHGLHDLQTGWNDLWGSLTPEDRRMLKDVFKLFMEFVLVSDLKGLATGLEFVAATFQQVGNVVHFLNGEFTVAKTEFNDIKTTIESWANALKGKFKEWGGDFIELLIQGIKDHLPNLNGIVNNIGQGIKNKLGFSKPHEGPLADADKWMPDMMLLLASGIEKGLPLVARASQKAAQTIGGPLMMGGSSNSSTSSTAYHSSTSYGGASTAIYLYGASSAQIVQALRQALGNADQQSNLKLRQPGGYRGFGWIG